MELAYKLKVVFANCFRITTSLWLDPNDPSQRQQASNTAAEKQKKALGSDDEDRLAGLNAWLDVSLEVFLALLNILIATDGGEEEIGLERSVALEVLDARGPPATTRI